MIYNNVNDPTGYLRRKAYRQARAKVLEGAKKVICPSCGGSGYYDAGNSPKCSSCKGSGKTLPNETSSALSAVQDEFFQLWLAS